MISFDLKVFKRNLHLHEKRVDIELVSNICTSFVIPLLLSSSILINISCSMKVHYLRSSRSYKCVYFVFTNLCVRVNIKSACNYHQIIINKNVKDVKDVKEDLSLENVSFKILSLKSRRYIFRIKLKIGWKSEA